MGSIPIILPFINGCLVWINSFQMDNLPVKIKSRTAIRPYTQWCGPVFKVLIVELVSHLEDIDLSHVVGTENEIAINQMPDLGRMIRLFVRFFG